MTNDDWNNIEHWLETLITEHSDDLNDWEKNFVNDMDMKFESEQEFTTAQMNKLEQIFKRYTK